MARHSAGILLYRLSHTAPEALIVHPGGPFWKNKDDGAWSIPKGEHEPEDDPISVALREFEEEIGTPAPIVRDDLVELGSVKQRSGKVVAVWAAAGDIDADNITSNKFEVEWPPRSGRTQEFPEVDRAGWFTFGAAKRKLLPGHVEFIDRLATHLSVSVDSDDGTADTGAPPRLFED